MAVTTHATMEADLRAASVLSQEIQLLLADRSSLRNTGALTNHGLINGQGSDTIQIRQAGLDGYDVFDATIADGADRSTPDSITDSSVSLAVARYSLRRDLSDMAELTGMGSNDINPARLALSMVQEAEQAFMGLVASTIAGFATDKGTSGSDLTVDDWFDGIRFLQAGANNGPFYALLHPTQLSDLQGSIRSEAGALQFLAATQDLISAKGSGYSGSFAGVDIYTSSRVTTAGGNVHGGMWAAGCLTYAEAAPVMSYGDVVRPGTSPLVVEFQRDASMGLTEVVGSYYVGMAITEAARGCGIVTDA